MIAVLTDSTCDLHPDSAQQMGIRIVPLQVTMQERTMLDWLEIDPDAVYDHMRTGGAATTAPVSVSAFAEQYRQLLKTHDAVLSLHLSGKLSETVRNAQEAAQALGETSRIHVLDTEVAGGPLAELAMVARTHLNSSEDLQGATKAVLDARDRMYSEMSVASLEYLRRSGRIGRAQALLGNMLNLRPILAFDRGELKATRRVKVDQAATDMLDSIKGRLGNAPVSVTIMHAGRDTVRINALRTAMAASGLNVQRGRVQLMGPVIGAHVGPGTYGFTALPLA